MKVEYRSSFAKDLRKLKQSKLRVQVREIIEKVEKAENLQQVEDIKKLRGAENYYRIKLGDYRLGLMLEGDVAIFVRFLHRRDIYRYFP